MKISATVITLNEQRHIRQCLESLQGIADEMIVVDSGSQDATLKIAAELGAKTFVREWTNYSDQKNFASSLAQHEWILSLDADECLSSSLRQDILQAKENSTQAVAFEFPRKAFYLGRWIEHSGWYPDHKVRLFLKNKARWEGRFVHETLRTDGPIVRLPGDLLHYSCESISEHLRTLDRYTTSGRRRPVAAAETERLGSPAGFGVFGVCENLLAQTGVQGRDARLGHSLFRQLLQSCEARQALGTRTAQPISRGRARLPPSLSGSGAAVRLGRGLCPPKLFHSSFVGGC